MNTSLFGALATVPNIPEIEQKPALTAAIAADWPSGKLD